MLTKPTLPYFTSCVAEYDVSMSRPCASVTSFDISTPSLRDGVNRSVENDLELVFYEAQYCPTFSRSPFSKVKVETDECDEVNVMTSKQPVSQKKVKSSTMGYWKQSWMIQAGCFALMVETSNDSVATAMATAGERTTCHFQADGSEGVDLGSNPQGQGKQDQQDSNTLGVFDSGVQDGTLPARDDGSNKGSRLDGHDGPPPLVNPCDPTDESDVRRLKEKQALQESLKHKHDQHAPSRVWLHDVDWSLPHSENNPHHICNVCQSVPYANHADVHPTPRQQNKNTYSIRFMRIQP
jgi:hypothetical protein